VFSSKNYRIFGHSNGVAIAWELINFSLI